ncbi:hypothetical protein B7494_g303 [Chlorociboria aeruginascens]|nr:hypothetical protein B7494_g303 [Chlorociboria aeruginascens]
MAAGIRGPMGLISLVLIAGSIVLILFVVLSGVTSTTPLKKTYFLQADTSTFIGSGRPVSQWTYFYVCGTDNADCGKPVPALPIGYAWIGGTEGVPSGLVGSRAKDTTSKYYYYMWRFGWVFYLMGLIFDVFAFFASLLAPCSRLASYFSGAILFFAVFWFSLGAALMTAVFVKARNEFHGAGISASLGRYAFGFTWGAWAAMFLAVITLFLGGGLSGARDTPTTRRSFFRRQSHRKSKGSFVDENGHRVKEEYS